MVAEYSIQALQEQQQRLCHLFYSCLFRVYTTKTGAHIFGTQFKSLPCIHVELIICVLSRLNSSRYLELSIPYRITVSRDHRSTHYSPTMDSQPSSAAGPYPGPQRSKKATFMQQTRLPFKTIQRQIPRSSEKPTSTGRHQHSMIKQLQKKLWQHWSKALLLFVPAGFIVNYIHLSGVNRAAPAIIFAVNFVAIFPTSGIVSHALEDLTCLIGDSWATLLYIVFGYVLESSL